MDGPVEKDSGVLLSAQTITSETVSTTTTTQITKVCSVFMFTMKTSWSGQQKQADRQVSSNAEVLLELSSVYCL